VAEVIRILRTAKNLALPDQEIAGSTYTKIVALNDVLTPHPVSCRRCGAHGRANPRLVGKARKIDGCSECL
jgi:hypothetical protein